MNSDTLPADRAVDGYLDDLLSEAPPRAVQPTPASAPEWPPRASDYLLCAAAGVRIALPMEQVDDVLPAPLEPAAAAGGAVYRHGEEGLRAVALCRVLADDLRDPGADMLVVLSGRRWALACHIEEETLRIAGADAQWRGPLAQRRQRPWLAGVHAGRDCALLDVPALLNMLDHDYPDETFA